MAAEAGGAPSAMQAWQYSSFGGGPDALQLRSGVAVPVPRAGEVLLRVQAASVNPVDWKLQGGVARPFLPPFLPYTPGFDMAGEVVAVGPNAGTLAKGDQVFGMVSPQRGGAFAQYAIAPVKGVARRPPNVSPAQAACLGVAGLTALQGLRGWGGISFGPQVLGFHDSPTPATSPPRQPGNVLITNASGGVGHYAVQLAKLAGQHVTATCGARNMEWVKSLGADEVLDYKTPEGQALSSPSGRKYDVLLDGTLSLTWKNVSPVLAPSGTWIHLTPNAGLLANIVLNTLTFARQKLRTFVAFPYPADLSILGRLSAEGRLKTRIDAEVPFSSAPDAWRKSQSGHVTGKVVLVADEPAQ